MLTSNCSFLGDLQEPFRWTADVTVMGAFESGVLDLPDFYFRGDDYRYRFDREAKQRFLDLFRERFNSAVRYKGRALKWDTIIEEKTSELGRFLVGKSSDIDFVEPAPKLLRLDDHELRDGILALTQSKARELGIGKSTFHYLRNNAKNDQPFKCYRKVLTRLSATSVDEC